MKNSAAIEKLIVFKIADYFLALPLTAVLKVINYPPANNGDIKAPGIIQIGRHAIALWDLHQILADSDRPQTIGIRPFLLIAQVLPGELCAIPVEEPPNLVELPKHSLRTLPQSFHHHQLRHLVSHVAVISEAEKTFTIFLVDLNEALSLLSNRSLRG